MKVIFEDHENALSSQLFRAAYINTADFIYTNGCGNIQNKLEELLAVNPNEHVYIYMDMIPANKSIKAVYRSLRSIAIKNSNIIIFPIICSEYMIIKAFGDYNNKDINICVSKGNYFESDSFKKDQIACRNFEKFCKYLLRNNMLDCASTDSIRAKEYYEYFYTKDCPCCELKYMCEYRSLVQKSVELLTQYDCVPSGAKSALKTELNKEELWDIHRKLVNEFNTFSDNLKSFDKRPDQLYFNIKSIR